MQLINVSVPFSGKKRVSLCLIVCFYYYDRFRRYSCFFLLPDGCFVFRESGCVCVCVLFEYSAQVLTLSSVRVIVQKRVGEKCVLRFEHLFTIYLATQVVHK